MGQMYYKFVPELLKYIKVIVIFTVPNKSTFRNYEKTDCYPGIYRADCLQSIFIQLWSETINNIR